MLSEIIKKIMLGTPDAWSTSHLSQRTSKPTYHIVDCRILSNSTTITYLSQSAHKLPQWSQRIIARVSPSSWLSQVGLEAVASPFHSPDERLSTWSLSNTQSEARLSHRTGSLRHSEGSLWGQTKVFE